MDGYCIYCTVPFGSIVRYKGKRIITYRNRDHFIPKSHGGKGTKDNMVESCNICNHIKRDKDFETGTDARVMILERLKKNNFIVINEALPNGFAGIKCLVCQKQFLGSNRIDAKFCSEKCKMAYHRMIKSLKEYYQKGDPKI